MAENNKKKQNKQNMYPNFNKVIMNCPGMRERERERERERDHALLQLPRLSGHG